MGQSEESRARGRKPDYADAVVAVVCGLALAFTALFLGVIPLERNLSGGRDFVVYWATGQQLVHHADPYDTPAMDRLEHGAGYVGKGTFYMRNPPWGLALTLPLGFFPAQWVSLPWSLMIFGVLALSAHLIWQILGRPPTPLPLLAYAFPPVLMCVVMGQTSLFLLLGLALFLRFHRTQPFWAGAGLWFCTLKPHVLLPFAVVLLLWIVMTRSYKVLLGALAALAVSCGATELLDPAAWAQYAHWSRSSGISGEFIPCLSVALRNWINPHAAWIAFVPCAIGTVFAVEYFRRHRHSWDWMVHGNLLVLVSLVVAPYCWVYDQSLALAGVLYGASRTRSRPLLAMLAAMYAGVMVQPSFTANLDSAFYIWPSIAWLVWFQLARRSPQSANVETAAVTAEALG